MADFEQALNALLSNPEAMGQIMNLAGMLEGKDGEAASASEAPPPADSPPAETRGEGPQLQQLLALLQAYQSTDEQSAALLHALRPFLREERRGKLDRAIHLAGISRALRQAYRLWKDGELHL